MHNVQRIDRRKGGEPTQTGHFVCTGCLLRLAQTSGGGRVEPTRVQCVIATFALFGLLVAIQAAAACATTLLGL